MAANFYKIGDKYWTIGDRNALQQISESDIRGRAGDLPAGTDALQYMRSGGNLVDVDPSKLSIATGYEHDNKPYQYLSYDGGYLPSGGLAYLHDQATAQALGLQAPSNLPRGQVMFNQDFANYLRDTGQTYSGGQFSGNPAQGIMGTQATQQGIQAGTIDPKTGQPIQQPAVNLQTLPKTYTETGWVNPQGVYENPQLSKSGQYYKVGNDVFNAQGQPVSLEQFKQLGLNMALLPEGKSQGGTGSIPGTPGGTSRYALDLLEQGAVATSQLPQERDAGYKLLESRLKASDDLISRIMSAMMPTEQENALQKQLNDLMSSKEAGMNKIEGESIAMNAIIGQQAQLERQANMKISAIQRELTRLSGNREAQAKMLETAYNFKRQSLSDALMLYERTAPEKLYFDEKSGTMYFKNPITNEISSQKLPGFTTPLEEKPTTSSITEYEYAKSQGYEGTYLDYQKYKATQFGTEGRGGGEKTTTDQNKIIAAFNKSLADANLIKQAGSRENLIKRLIVLYPQIDPDDIATAVYSYWQDNYEATLNKDREV